MAEDFDVEAMLEAPYKKDDDGHISSPLGGIHSNGKRKDGESGKRRSRSTSRDIEASGKRKMRSSRDGGGDRERDRDREHRPSDRHRTGRDEREHREHRKRSRDDRNVERHERSGGGGGGGAGAGGTADRRTSPSEKATSRGGQSRSRDGVKRSGSRDARRSRSKDKQRSRHRRSKSRDAKQRSRSPQRRRKSRSPQPSKSKRRSHTPGRPFRRGRTPPNGLGDRSPAEDLSPEKRDARTVFCMQLSQRIRARDLEEFFSSVGKVRDVRLITCNKTKRFKGIAYIEFKYPESVPLALGLSGQRLLGIPISVQHTQAEKNRLANALPNLPPKNHVGPMRLYVGSLHFNITEDMLKGIFEPFGKIDTIQLIMDTDTNRSKGYGFITFHNADDAKKALEQLNGFELAGRPMKVGNVTERLDVNTTTSLDIDKMDRTGIDLGATGRLQLMFKLAEGAGLAVPQAAANALLATAPQPPQQQQQLQMQQQQSAPAIATQCFLLSNMFDPTTETNPTWDIEICDDVIEECKKHGGVLHVFVDQTSQGNVYVKCPSIATAVLAVNSLHGRWFAGRIITAAYVPLVNYHSLFPDALTAQILLNTTRKT